MSNYKRTILYVGVTSEIEWRVLAHKKGEGSKFTRLYRVFYLVYYERFPTILQAIEREKQLKRWKRQWKLNLIQRCWIWLTNGIEIAK